MREMNTLAPEQASDLLPTPPPLPGLPLLGHAFAFRRDPVELFRRGYEQLGPIFTIRLGPKPAAVILGPEANEFFFSETDRLLSMRLRELEAHGIVTRQVYNEPPLRVEYALTAKGEALRPAVTALRSWACDWLR